MDDEERRESKPGVYGEGSGSTLDEGMTHDSRTSANGERFDEVALGDVPSGTSIVPVIPVQLVRHYRLTMLYISVMLTIMVIVSILNLIFN